MTYTVTAQKDYTVTDQHRTPEAAAEILARELFVDDHPALGAQHGAYLSEALAAHRRHVWYTGVNEGDRQACRDRAARLLASLAQPGLILAWNTQGE